MVTNIWPYMSLAFQVHEWWENSLPLCVDFLFGDGCLNIQMQGFFLLQNPLKQGQKNLKEKKKEIQKCQILNK